MTVHSTKNIITTRTTIKSSNFVFFFSFGVCDHVFAGKNRLRFFRLMIPWSVFYCKLHPWKRQLTNLLLRFAFHHADPTDRTTRPPTHYHHHHLSPSPISFAFCHFILDLTVAVPYESHSSLSLIFSPSVSLSFLLTFSVCGNLFCVYWDSCDLDPLSH